MHCPRCGQQQVSVEIKFCSRCGFPLGLVSEILAYGGFLPQLAELSKKKKLPTRKTGIKIGFTWMVIFLLIFAPLFGIANEDDGAMACAVIGLMGGFLMMLLSWLFLEKAAKPLSDQTMMAGENHAAQFLSQANRAQTALPPQTSQPADNYIPPTGAWKAPNTGEFANPGSVTERTTKLLQKDE